MLALMMDRALSLPSILEYAATYHGDREVVTRTIEGPIHRYGYADALAMLSAGATRLGTSGSAVILGEARRVDAGGDAVGAVDASSY